MNIDEHEKEIKIKINVLTAMMMIIWVINLISINAVYPSKNDPYKWEQKTEKISDKKSDKKPDKKSKKNIVIAGREHAGRVYRLKVSGPGLEKNDILLSIDGINIPELDSKFWKINKISKENFLTFKIKNKTAQYRIIRSGQELMIPIQLKENRASGIIIPLIGFFFLMTGYLVIINNPLNSFCRLFYYLSFVFFLAFITDRVFFQGGVFIAIVSALKIIGVLLLIPAMIHFFNTFPEKNPKIKNRSHFLYSTYALPVAIIIFIEILEPFALVLALRIIVVFTKSINYFRRTCKKNKDEKLRNPLRVIYVGTTICFFSLLMLLRTEMMIKPIADGILLMFLSLLVLIPLSFAYAVMKYELMDVSIVVKKGIVYSFTTAAFILFYMVGVLGLGGFLARQTGLESRLLNMFFVGLVALIFNPVKEGFQKIVDRKFYPNKYHYQKALLELSRELPMSIKLDEILSRVSTCLIDTVKVEKIIISVRQAEDRIYRIFNQFGVPQNCDCDFIENSRGLIEVLSIHHGCISFRNKNHQALREPISEEDMVRIMDAGFVLAVPMHHRDQLGGMILLGPKSSGECYTDEDMDLLNTVAGQTAVAVENARMHIEEINRQRMTEEICLAQRIQKNLLPKKSPGIPGLEVAGCSIPAYEVGGDYFDYIQRGQEELLVFVGDVSGKGMPAALYMSKVQGMLQASSSLIISPKNILLEVNSKITGEIEKGSFVTMSVILFDLVNRKAITCRAGHTPLLVKRANQNHAEVIKTEGIGLGIMSGGLFEKKMEETVIDFNPGDIFVLFSDGLVESMNRDGVLFGLERVLGILRNHSFDSAEELRLKLIQMSEEFRMGSEQNDDITLVVVMIK